MKTLKFVIALLCAAVVYTSCRKSDDVKPNAASHFSGKLATDTSGGDEHPYPPK
jgi:hypothetical protein